MKTEFEREEFFNLCWEKSISWFCKNYLLSYHEFKTICAKYHIPLPPNGYWMKRKYGKGIRKPILPPIEITGKIKLLFRTIENLKKSESNTKQNTVGDNQKKNDLKVPEKLPKNLDPIIQEMLSDNPRRHPITNNIRDYTKRYKYGRISVSASKSHYKRTLCFLNTFIRVMKSRGHYFLFCYEESYVVIEGIEIAIRIRERSKKVYVTDERDYRTSRLEPTGLLTFLAGNYTKKAWQETLTTTLAKKLPLIINYLEEKAKKERKWKVENERRLRKEAIEKERQEEIKKLQKKEIEKLRFIKQQSDLWHEAKRLKSFLNACDMVHNLSEEMKGLVTFGYQKAEFLDPLVKGNDELFENVEPYKLLQIIR